MDAGELVPDELIIALVKQRLGQKDCQERGWLLDGFPRTRAQGLAMQSMGILPDKVFLLDVPDELLVERVTGRRSDPVTGKIYHMKFAPPPQDETILRRLVQRSDDTEETIRTRLKAFHRNISSIVDLYSSILVRVDGTLQKDKVFVAIKNALS